MCWSLRRSLLGTSSWESCATRLHDCEDSVLIGSRLISSLSRAHVSLTAGGVPQRVVIRVLIRAVCRHQPLQNTLARRLLCTPVRTGGLSEGSRIARLRKSANCRATSVRHISSHGRATSTLQVSLLRHHTPDDVRGQSDSMIGGGITSIPDQTTRRLLSICRGSSRLTSVPMDDIRNRHLKCKKIVSAAV